MALSLIGKVGMLSRQLDGAGIAHAFGGGLVLPLYGQIRATDDIDVGVFVGVDQCDVAFGALGGLGIDVEFSAEDRERILAGGWVTVGFDGTPVDVFFAMSPMHTESSTRVRRVPLGDNTVPVLGVEDFVAHKVLFGRPQDWVDIDSVVEANPGLDSTIVGRWLAAEGAGREVRRRAVAYNAIAARHGAAQLAVPPKLPRFANWFSSLLHAAKQQERGGPVAAGQSRSATAGDVGRAPRLTPSDPGMCVASLADGRRCRYRAQAGSAHCGIHRGR
jgi:hypothetical protein